MSPQEFVQSLCSRYGVPRVFGERMLPLVERSKKVRPEMRERLLAFVERSFAAEATRRAGEPSPPDPREAQVLRTVAGALHGWTPPPWLDLWARKPRPDGSGPGGPEGTEPSGA